MTVLPLPTTADLRARRLIAQLLAPSAAHPRPNDLNGVASYLTAIQAQNAAAGRDGLALRLGIAPGAVTPADLAEAQVVRSWSQRGTHHLLAARDVRWITLLCSPRVQRASQKRRGRLGLTDTDVDRCRDALLAAAGTPVTRTGAYALFRSIGVDPDDGRGPHMLRHFGGEGDLIQGTPIGGEETFLLHDVAVADPVDLTGPDALREIAVRYFRSRGPATVHDLAWWTGLTMTDAKQATALATATGTVVPAESTDGRTLYLADWQVDVTDEELADAVSPDRPPLCLPAFDEYLMAYTDRSDVMTPEVAKEVGPTRNGLAFPCSVHAGTVTGRR
ncbi:winged helix DNA-binding domain-containing protein [Corynebacterium terpenotabidum]|nr:winged helix DNA-binding domain-containing protein [Corynebacterium terpenotabidum]